jgi:hypothetical protein
MASGKDSRTGGKAPDNREDRLKAALKANLARRKAQGRLRKGAESPEDEDAAQDRLRQDKDR